MPGCTAQDIIDARIDPAPAQAVWTALREARGWLTVSGLAARIIEDPRTIRSALTRWAAAGLLECDGGRPKRWRLIKDTGVEAPSTKGNAQARIWRAAKVLKSFQAEDIMMAAQVRRETAQSYLKWLVRGGYVIIEVRGNPHHATRWRLLPSRWTGPGAPMVQTVKRLYDPNTKTVVWPKPAPAPAGGAQ